jgi:DNA-binding NarL/FixJ family response regulator
VHRCSAADQGHGVAVIDDEPLIRSMLHSLIDARQGLRHVGEAPDGQAGLDLAVESSTCAVVLDGSMPVLDGWAAAHIMRARRPELVIVMYSADEPPGRETIAADAVVPKSAGPRPLLLALERFLLP